MILASFVSSPPASWLDSVSHIIFVASAGGAVVIVGLFLEWYCDNGPYRTIKTFRRCKCWKEVGEWMVIAGILIEIGSGTWLGINGLNEAASMRAEQKRLDPLNQPVSDFSARMVVKLKGTNFILTSMP